MSQLEDQAEIVQFYGFMISFFRTYEELYFYRKAGVAWDWGVSRHRSAIPSTLPG